MYKRQDEAAICKLGKDITKCFTAEAGLGDFLKFLKKIMVRSILVLVNAPNNF